MTEADSVALHSGLVCLINSSEAWRQVSATVPALAALPLDQSVWMDAVGGILIPDSAPLQFCERSGLNWERGSASSTVSNIKSHFRNTTSVEGKASTAPTLTASQLLFFSKSDSVRPVSPLRDWKCCIQILSCGTSDWIFPTSNNCVQPTRSSFKSPR